MQIKLDLEGVLYRFDVSLRAKQKRIIIKPFGHHHYRVTAPKYTPKHVIKAMLEQDLTWKETLPKMWSYEEYLMWSNTIDVLGEPHRVEWLESNQNEVRLRAGVITVMMKKNDPIKKAQLLKHYMTRLLTKEVQWLIESYSRKQQEINLDATKLQFKPYRSRFGSCHTKDRVLSFNLVLAHYPIDYLEYVFVHEMVHLKEAHHGKAFYEVLARLLPDHTTLKAALNQHHEAFFKRSEVDA